ncbi:chitinase [Sinomonas atrocyanea]
MARPSARRRAPFLLLGLGLLAALVTLGLTIAVSSTSGPGVDSQGSRGPSAPGQGGTPATSGAAASGPASGSAPGSASGIAPWFGGYADVTLKPLYPFDDSSPDGRAVLAFVIADPANPCEPSWGGQYSLDKAATELDLDHRVAQLRAKGHGVALSFGGAAGDELARKCPDARALAQAYRKVIDRYAPDLLDFDIEARNLSDVAATERRVQALRQVLGDLGAPRMPQVWLTLPVTAQGLSPEASAVVLQTVRGGVDLAGVNIMTMDYEGPASGQKMLQTSIEAATSTHGQLAQIFGLGQGQEAQAWKKLGLTPMIGANDVVGETFDLQAARGLNQFVHDRGIARLSMWSLNRDRACSPGEGLRQNDGGGPRRRTPAAASSARTAAPSLRRCPPA